MDHTYAVETQAVERYLLGELTPEERDAFEEHYFTCADCAVEVRSAARFRANSREVLKEPEPEPSPEKARGRGWFSWLPMIPVAASVMLAGVVIYQNAVVIPALRLPRTLFSPLILDGATRGSLPEIGVGEPLDFMMAAPASGEAGLTPELANESGKVLARGPAAKAVPDQPYHVYFPGDYGPGRYLVIIRDAASGKELAQNKFEIAAKESNTR